MRYYFSAILILVTFSGCFSPTPQQTLYIKNKTKLYTQYTIWIKHSDKNLFYVNKPFIEDTFVLPINSEVIVRGFRKDLIMDYRGRTIKYNHISVVDENGKVSNKAKQNLFDNLLQPTPLNLNSFTKLEQGNIEINEVVEGMSKEAVMTSIGIPFYPMTFSFNDNKWYYGNALLIVFKNNKAIRVKDNRVVMTKQVNNIPFK